MWFIFGGRLPQTRGVFSTVLLKSVAVCLYAPQHPILLPTIKVKLHYAYTRSIMNVSRARFTHSRQNGTLAESRSEEGSLTGSSAQPDTWRNPHASPPFQPGTHTDRAITARGEGPRPAVFRPICCVSVQGRDGRGWGATSRRIRFQFSWANWGETIQNWIDPNLDRSGRSFDHIRRCDPKLDRFLCIFTFKRPITT